MGGGGYLSLRSCRAYPEAGLECGTCKVEKECQLLEQIKDKEECKLGSWHHIYVS